MIPLPELHKLVWVMSPEHEVELCSRVEDEASNRLTLSAPSDGKTAYLFAPGTVIEIGWLTPRGRAWVAGLVAETADSPVPSLVIHLLGQPTLVRRRKHVRVAAALDVTVRAGGRDGDAARGTTTDLSGGGLQARVPLRLVPDDVVQMTVHLPDEAPVELTARVVRRVDDVTLAYRFELIAPVDRDRLIRFGYSLLRDALSPAQGSQSSRPVASRTAA